jgi:hypothetical protein
MGLLHGLFPAPAWPSFVRLACGGALATDRHTIPTYWWLTGATTVQHFSRFSVFLGGPLYTQRWPLWGAVIRQAAPLVPEGESLEGIRPRKKPVGISRGARVTAMVRAQPGKQTGRGGA